MKSFDKIDFSTSPLCEIIMLIFQTIRKDFSIEDVYSELRNRVDEARIYISAESNQNNQLKKLLELFYERWRFGGANGKYLLSDVLWLDNVLQTRKGTAVSLGIILLHIAQELELPLMPVIFPTQLILRVKNKNNELWLIDPFNGNTLDKHTLGVWLKGNISPTAKLYDNDLDQADSTTVIRKILDTLKTALMEEKKMELALNVSNILLQINPDDPYEIRDRGLIYAQLECNHIALTDLIYFVEHCPEDPISEIIKIQIHSIEQRQITLH
ncbi:invasion regulator SirB1 [Buchnera aphidicola (Formosaphis micheliae)]|uniref:invasion regulator SirB1 n=1 Tax=Buchnera aphidicola TaxID=9 RepID=UPI0031CC8C33